MMLIVVFSLFTRVASMLAILMLVIFYIYVPVMGFMMVAIMKVIAWKITIFMLIVQHMSIYLLVLLVVDLHVFVGVIFQRFCQHPLTSIDGFKKGLGELKELGLTVSRNPYWIKPERFEPAKAVRAAMDRLGYQGSFHTD